MVTILPRTAWTSTPDERDTPLQVSRVDAITVHYPVGRNTKGWTREQVAAGLRAIRASHLNRTWRDIGYNYAVDQSGRVWHLTGDDVGAHANVVGNTTSIGVVFIVGTSEEPTPELIESFLEFRAARLLKFTKMRRVQGHQQVPGNSTACPGVPIMRLVRSGALIKRPGTPVAPPSTDRMDPASYFIGAVGNHVTWLGERLILHGYGAAYNSGPGPNFTEADRLNVASFQRAQGWTGDDADGLPGKQSLTILAAEPKSIPTPTPAPVPTPTPEPTPAKTLTDYTATDFGPGKFGPQVTLLGQRLVAHGFGKYKVGPGPSWGDVDKASVQDFQLAQGWKGTAKGGDADGYPGAQTLARLELEPAPKPETVEVISAIQNMAGNNAHGIKTAKARMARYVAAREATPVHVINAQETTVVSTVRPRLDSGLKPLGYKRAGGGKGRYCYTRGVKIIDAGLFTVPSKLWYRRDDKQAAWVVYEIDGARGMDVSLHLESDSGTTADNLRVKQALWIETAALSKAKALNVPEQNVMLTGDTNSEGMVLDALVNAGWRNAAYGTGYENMHTFTGWDGRSRKRFDYALVRSDAAVVTVEALAYSTDISDHAGLRVSRQLTK